MKRLLPCMLAAGLLGMWLQWIARIAISSARKVQDRVDARLGRWGSRESSSLSGTDRLHCPRIGRDIRGFLDCNLLAFLLQAIIEHCQGQDLPATS